MILGITDKSAPSLLGPTLRRSELELKSDIIAGFTTRCPNQGQNWEICGTHGTQQQLNKHSWKPIKWIVGSLNYTSLFCFLINNLHLYIFLNIYWLYYMTKERVTTNEKSSCFSLLKTISFSCLKLSNLPKHLRDSSSKFIFRIYPRSLYKKTFYGRHYQCSLVS